MYLHTREHANTRVAARFEQSMKETLAEFQVMDEKRIEVTKDLLVDKYLLFHQGYQSALDQVRTDNAAGRQVAPSRAHCRLHVSRFFVVVCFFFFFLLLSLHRTDWQ